MVAILVVVASGVVISLEGSEATAAVGIAQRELTELRNAALQFRRDTGHFPRRGPFALVADGGRIDPAEDSHWPQYAPAYPAEREAWFRSPTNFYQLYEERGAPSFQVALDVIAGPGVVFNPETRRGYRGPYLSRHGEGFTYVQYSLGTNGDGDLLPGTPGTGSPMPGVADPFSPVGVPFPWTSSPFVPDGVSPAYLGRPYALFVVAPAPGELGPRIVSIGPNGKYDSDAVAIWGDDLVVFLEE